MPQNQHHISSHASKPNSGPFLARVMSHMDSTYMGVLQVQILRPTGNSGDSGQLIQAKYLSPFYGVTGADYVRADPDNYNNTQKSYGMWMVPPDVGTTVVVIFIDGDPKRAYWMGCVPDEGMNFMVPGIAATTNNVEKNYKRSPVAEYNKKIPSNNSPADSTKFKKPEHPLAKVLDKQGLIKDDIRGITTSSSRREVPSAVFGISTPGPLDKQSGATRGQIGKNDHAIPNAFVSRLGGTTFVMDDGDDKFLRKTAPTDGPPDYAAVQQGETGGDVTIPHNELFRIRTRTGHQILMHNSEDLIYITNSRGTSWIELTSDGKIDIYAQDSISVHTGNDLNFYADRDINFEAGRNFNLKVAERHQTEVGKDKITIVNGNVAIQVDGTQDETITGAHKQSLGATWDVTAGGQTNMTIGGGFDLNTSGSNKLTSGGTMEIGAANTTISGGNINLNGPAAASAGSASAATAPDPLPTIDNPTETDGVTITSILARIPTTEPYPHHENLDATMFKPDATDRETATAIPVPPAWKEYTTNTDPFNKVTGA
jgi:Type VI secretion system/phage-baseplate injector OB domain